MKEKQNRAALRRGGETFCLAFLLFAALYFAGKGYPLGDRIFLRSDSVHQYLPFMAELRRKLVSGDSLLYSFGGGLGYNYLASICYYLASPFNILLLLMPQEMVAESMSLIMFLKVSLAGGIAAWYLDRENSQSDPMTVVFGLVYAFSAFFVGYYFNLMWLDSILVLPLILAGIRQLLREKDGRLYCGALGYGLLCNYYVGYMLCLFSCIAFAVEFGLTFRRGEWKTWFANAARFAFFSILAAGLACVLLLPAWYSIQQTRADNFTSIGWKTFYANWLDMAARCFSPTTAVTYSSGGAEVNLYCGNTTLILLGMYFLDRRRSLREKLVHGAVLAFLVLSINNKALTILWNGLHLPNGFAGRFTWIYSFWVIFLAYQGFRSLSEIGGLRLAAAIGTPFLVMDAYCLFRLEDGKLMPWLLTMHLLAAGGIILWQLRSAPTDQIRRIALAALCLLMVGESVGYAWVSMEITGKGVRRSAYCGNLEEMENLDYAYPEGFYRMDVDERAMSNEDLYLGLRGMNLFSSTIQGDFNQFFQDIGVRSRLNKLYYECVSAPFSDLFGIRYLLSEAEGDTLYHMEKAASGEKLNLFESKTALSLGVMMPEQIRNWDSGDYDSYADRQESFLSMASGVYCPFSLREKYSLEKGPKYIVRLAPEGDTYLEITRDIESVKITTPQYTRTFKTYTKGLYYLGRMVGDDNKVNVEVSYADNQKEVPVRVYTVSDADNAALHDTFASRQMEVELAEGSRILGHVTAQENQVLFLSIPYDAGWTATVDGKPAETFPIGGAFLGVKVPGGNRTVDLRFCPQGLIPGSCITAVSLCIYALAWVLTKKKRRK